MGWLYVTALCWRGAAEPPAGVSAVGLHQPPPEERHRGDRKCHWDQQSLTAPGWAQVSFPKPKGKSWHPLFLFASVRAFLPTSGFNCTFLLSTWSHSSWTRVALWSTIIRCPPQVRHALHNQPHRCLVAASVEANGFSSHTRKWNLAAETLTQTQVQLIPPMMAQFP